VNELLRYLKW